MDAEEYKKRLNDALDSRKEKPGTQEYHLQVAAIDYLRGQLRNGRNVIAQKRPFPELFDEFGNQRFTHIYQGRSKEEGFFLGNLGLRRGVLDIMLWPNWFAFLEAKVTTGLSRDQKQFAGELDRLGVRWAVFKTVAEVRDILIGWGLKCEQPVCQEPKMTKKEQEQHYLNMMRPL